jgi:hypothetical protein
MLGILDTRQPPFRNARRKQPLPYQQAGSLIVHQKRDLSFTFLTMYQVRHIRDSTGTHPGGSDNTRLPAISKFRFDRLSAAIALLLHAYELPPV